MTAAPFPSDTRAKGWRFEIDIERIRQSDTWALATPEVRPWLLLLWVTAWEQVPCGSLPNDDALIAARIGMTPKAFAKAKPVLMRGWAEADDGRLYHSTITARVLAMLETKRKESERKAAYRARMDAERTRESANVPRDRRGTDTVRDIVKDGGSDPGRDATGTGTGTGTGLREEISPTAHPKPAARGTVHRFPPGFETLWAEYPRKVGKDAAARAFAKRRPDESLLSAMVAAVRTQRQSEQWTRDGGQFIPHLATWLNAGRWQDEEPPAAVRGNDVFAGAM